MLRRAGIELLRRTVLAAVVALPSLVLAEEWVGRSLVPPRPPREAASPSTAAPLDPAPSAPTPAPTPNSPSPKTVAPPAAGAVQPVAGAVQPVAGVDAAGSAAQPASYLQYEPQNVPPASDLPPPLQSGLMPLSPPSSFEMPVPDEEQRLPWIAPYGTQFLATWNSGSGDNLGITDLDVRQTLVLPHIPGVIITPGFAAHLLNGPSSTDLPPTLHDNWIEVRWLKKFNDRWAMDLAITPSFFSDYQNTSGDAVRIMGRAIGLWSWTPELQLAFGFIYLDREDIAALPAAGLVWTPHEEFKAELLFPRPRLMWRLSGDDESSRWLFVGGEFAGGSWAVERQPLLGQPIVLPPVAPFTAPWNDVVTYSALRFLVGVEAKRAKGFAPRVEVGWVFNRTIRYSSGIGDFNPGDAAMIRVGGSF